MASEPDEFEPANVRRLRLRAPAKEVSIAQFEDDGGALAPVGGFGADEEEQVRALNLLDYIGIVIKWRWLIIGALVLGAAVGVVTTLLTTPVFQATATIQIDHEPAKIQAVQNDQADYFDSEEFYQTEYALLKSRALAERVVQRQGLARNPRFLNQGVSNAADRKATPQTAAAQKAIAARAAGMVQGGLRIDPVHGSRLVKVSFQSPDPQIAAVVANAAAETFINWNLEHRYDASSYARKFLEERLEQTRQKLEESERQAVAYAARNQIITLNIEDQAPGGHNNPSQTSLAASDLSAMNQTLSAATGARIQAEQRWRQASATDALSLPDVLANSSIQSAIANRAQLQAEYQQNLTRLKPDHPTMVADRARIETLDRQITAQAQSIKDSLRHQYEVALLQEQKLADKVTQDKDQVLDQRVRSIQYNILQREVDTNKTLYEGLLQRYKEIGVAGAIDSNNISIVDTAKVPGLPFKPIISRNLGFFGIAGLALGFLLAFLLERFDVSIKVPEDVERKLGMALLGTIPKNPRDVPTAGALTDPRSVLSEAYYSVRTALQFSTQDGVPSTLLVTSARPSEGKTTTSLALARSFARLGMRVLLVDADMRDPSLHRLLARDNGVGLSNILSGGLGHGPALQPTDQENLTFLACGPRPPNPGELLSGDKLRAFLTWAKEKFDLVVLDGPPVLGLTDAPLLADAAAGTVMVIEAGVTKRELARMALHRLRMVRSHLVGVILTKFDIRKAGYSYGYMYGHGTGYGYGYDYGSKAPPTRRLLDLPARFSSMGRRFGR